MGRFLGGTGKCDFPIPHIFNGLWPLKMTALPCAGLVFAGYGRKLVCIRKRPSMGRFLGGTGKCDWLIDIRVYPLFGAAKQTKIAPDDFVPIPHIFNGL